MPGKVNVTACPGIGPGDILKTPEATNNDFGVGVAVGVRAGVSVRVGVKVKVFVEVKVLVNVKVGVKVHVF